jgi:hypothetical protein
MASIFEELAQSQPTRNRAEKLAGLEIDLLRHRRRLAAGIARDLRDIIPGIGLGVTIDGIVVEHAQYSCHLFLPDHRKVLLSALPTTMPAIAPPF